MDVWMDGSYGIVENEKAHVIMMMLQGRVTIQLCQWLVTPKTQREEKHIASTYQIFIKSTSTKY